MRAVWEVIGGIAVDTGTCAFAAVEGLPESLDMLEVEIPPSTWRMHDLVPMRIPLVACETTADMVLSVDVQRDTSGEVIAARMVFVDDFDELEGMWRSVDHLEIPDGRCAALDPWIGRREPPYWFESEVKPGTYEVVVFDFRYDDGVEDRLGTALEHELNPAEGHRAGGSRAEVASGTHPSEVEAILRSPTKGG